MGVLVANKVDLEQRRIVDSDQGRDVAKKVGLKYAEMSAVRQPCDHGHLLVFYPSDDSLLKLASVFYSYFRNLVRA